MAGLLIGVLAAAASAAGGDSPIVPPHARLEHLFTRTAPIRGGLTEGPACAPDGCIYFSDIPQGRDPGMILRFCPADGQISVFAADSRKSNGLAFDPWGRLIACEGADFGGRGVARYDLASGRRTVLVDRFEGRRFNAPNDVVVDRLGRAYFSDPKYVGPEPRELAHRSVYRVDPEGAVIEITRDVEKPNGLALSPDERTLYVADNNNNRFEDEPDQPPQKGAMKLYAFPLDAEGRIAGPRQTLIDFGDRNGIDGMCVDVAGNLYLALRDPGRPGVLVVDPRGRELALIETASLAGEGEPAMLPSNVEFGRGDEAATLYVTIDKGLYRIRLAVAGYHPPLRQ